MNKTIRALLYPLYALLVFAVALGLRTYAANNLSIDYDEDDYLRAGQEFAHLIKTDNWSGFLQTNYRPEHPQLAKIMFGLSIVGLPEKPLIADLPITANPVSTLPPDLLAAARNMSAIWGSLTAMLLALINPLGGLILAMHSFTIKYTSQVMLDGFASLMSTATAVAYYLSKGKTGKTKTIFLLASAIFLGASASSKYLHSAVGFAILIDWFLSAREANEARKFFRNAFLWGVLSLAAFFVFNPFYWPDPLERIQVTYEAVSTTTTNPNVEKANLPTWQPLIHLSSSVPVFWNEEGFLFRVDGIIFIFAILGIAQTWKKNRFVAIWLFVDLFILLIWRTKWAQYILVATAPLSFVAAEGIKSTGANLVQWWQTRHQRRKEAVKPSRTETVRAIPWLMPGLFAFLVLTIFPLLFQMAISVISLDGNSLRDGFQGGIWREFWGGVFGQINPNNLARDGKVHYIGFQWYREIFNWINAMGMPFFNTMWTVVSVTLQTVLGVGAALLLWQRGVKFRKGWQALFILPWAIPEAIGAMLWLNIFVPLWGWISLASKKFGPLAPLEFFTNWERSPDTAFLVLLVVALWYGFPFMMLAASAGLKLLPQEVFDAAAIDGASAWQTFRYITWPLIMPLIVPAIIIRAIFAFNQFYLFQMFYFVNPDFNMRTLASLSYFLVYDWRDFTASAIIN
ncbi:MAG: sugar ABC transporter permease, partial [Anaerolineales bacterium]|nr:sugar ABC transporter permease [Anaerolineales bacterium]